MHLQDRSRTNRDNFIRFILLLNGNNYNYNIQHSHMAQLPTGKSNNKTKLIKKIESKERTTLPKNINTNSAPKQKDDRFSRAQYDPKFMTPSSKVTKVKIDKRFSKMMNDPAFKSTSTIDRYGRKINKEDENNELQQYYYMEDEQKADKDESAQNEEEIIDQQGSQKQEGEDGIRVWMDNYDEQSSELEDMEIDELEEAGNEVWSSDSQHLIKNDQVQVTTRLALCNYDWMNISAKDLMLLFSSFKTNTGYIKSIKIYMSNIGKEKLQLEQKYGPQGIWNDKPEEQPEQKKKEWKKSWKQLLAERDEQDNNAFDEDKLRQYEKQRLKYFYAVVECDSKKTADQIYKQCDGNQFQNSNILFDLRFIPDDISFDSVNLKDECRELPVGGEIKNFVNRAMGHSKCSLSWQDPELSLVASLKKKNWNKMSEADLDKVDWGMYLNQQDLEEDDNMKKLVREHVEEKQIIADWKKGNNKKYRKQEDDIEITFEGGFSQPKGKKNQKLTAKEEAKSEVPSLKQQKKSMKERWRDNEEQRKKKRDQLELMVDDSKKVDFKVDLQDDRFKAVYQNPSFAIDPVDPHFDHRRVGKVFEEVVRRNKDKHRE